MYLLNDKIKTVTSGEIEAFFDKIFLEVTFSSPEASVMKIVSYYYIIVFEGKSKINFNFMEEKAHLSNFESNLFSRFRKLIHTLRTVQQHNVSVEKSGDKEKIYAYEDWLLSNTGKSRNFIRSDWNKCSKQLVSDFKIILDEIEKIIIDIDKSEFKDLIIEDWIGKLKHHFPIYRYKDITVHVCENLGFKHLNIEKFCQRYYSSWISELSGLGSYVFEHYAVLQVERDFIKDFNSNQIPLPVTSDEIIKLLDLKPGPNIREVINQAHLIFHSSPCSSSELLNKLKDFYSQKSLH